MYEKNIDKLVGDFLKHKSISPLICDMYGNTTFENELYEIAGRCIIDRFSDSFKKTDKRQQLALAMHGTYSK